MAARPIIFSGPMVRALLDGRKTQTRRVLTAACDESPAFVSDGVVTALDEKDAPYRWPRTLAIGDRLWVREAFAYIYSAPISAIYRSDGERQPGAWGGRSWRTSIHMPRWASRLTLIVTDVRVQRLQEISRDDCYAEGAITDDWLEWREDANSIGMPPDSRIEDERDVFRALWDSINAKRGYGWDTNPWVVALTFTVHHCNIDAMAGAA